MIDEALNTVLAFPPDGHHNLFSCLKAVDGGRTMYFSNGLENLKVGKMEGEPPDWRKFYDRLAALGLIEYRIECRQGKGMVDGGPHFTGKVVTTGLGINVIDRYYK